jgi:hypothetical protein
MLLRLVIISISSIFLPPFAVLYVYASLPCLTSDCQENSIKRTQIMQAAGTAAIIPVMPNREPTATGPPELPVDAAPRLCPGFWASGPFPRWPENNEYAELQNPEYTGHCFRFELDTHSGKVWTLIPVLTGHHFRFYLDTFSVVSGWGVQSISD